MRVAELEAALREREEMPNAERFLNARVVSMPEAVHRTWGFRMRSGTGVTHLNTQLPHLRMRAIQARATEDRNNDAESDSESEGNSEGEGDDCGLQFADGALEQYQNRPTDEDGTDDGYWGSMLYTDFHRK